MAISKRYTTVSISILWMIGLITSYSYGQEHPRLILTQADVLEIRSQLGKVPVFDRTLAHVKMEVDTEMAVGIQVPVPKDMAGGYTHERHKKNFFILQKAGILFQILGQEKYAIYVRDMLMEYAQIYPTLPLHPQKRSYARGKLFWQCLNDANWLVYTSQAYDCIYTWLTEKERNLLETKLFRPYAHFLSVETPQFFNRIHNHSTWGNVAVGMIGLVMDDDVLINSALYGIKQDQIQPGQKDNDGGLLKVEGQKAGFLANLEAPFSPDGYYTEGPYYQRYAMYPFMIFAQALQNARPELHIFKYKEGVLLKAVYALLNLTDSDGDFFPLNDAQKGMSYASEALVTATAITYYFGEKDPALLSIVEKQGKVNLSITGLAAALAIRDGKAIPFVKKSIVLRDGSEGRQGGIGILRSPGVTPITLVMKYTGQGLSHGHYDKLSFSLYHDGNEVIQDYGLARFVNIEQKNGGGYLKENTSWAKQTIAHNTLVKNETSHFDGTYEIGVRHHSEKYFFDSSDSIVQVMSAKDTHAYPETLLHRTMALISADNFEKPLVLDLLRVCADTESQYDLPYYYLGQLIETDVAYTSPEFLSPLGTANGYQHLWKEGIGVSSDDNAKMTWLSNGYFYTLTTVASKKDQFIFARIGAKDPEFNLRRDPAFMIRKNKSKTALYASVVEAHGSYDPVSEMATNAHSNITNVKVRYHDDAYTAVTIKDKEERTILFIVANKIASKTHIHTLAIGDKVHRWAGPYHFSIIK